MTDKDIVKEYGNVLLDASAIVDDPPPVIPVSPKLDVGLGGGVPEGSLFIITGKEKLGKDQPMDAIVYCDDGPKTMGEISVGDNVCCPSSNTGFSKVVGIYPQGKQKVYRVYFSDGTYADCGEGHLWKIAIDKDYNNQKIMPLSGIIGKKLTKDRGGYKQALYSVDIEECYYSKKDILLDPYMFGAILGDGTFSSSILITNVDEYILGRVSSSLDKEYSLHQTKDEITYSISRSSQKAVPNGQHKYINALKHYGLYKTKSRYKFIPEEYKYNLRDNRLEIVRGLMDTDGTVTKDGRVSFSSSSKRLAYDISEVIRSLGYKCRISKRSTSCNGKSFISYRVYISGYNMIDLFGLPRKKNRCVSRSANLHKNIMRIEYRAKRYTQCIKLEDKSGLYFTNGHTVTHNTILALQFCANAQKVKIGTGKSAKDRKIYYGNVEGRLKKRDLEGIYGLDYSSKNFKIVGSTKGNILSGEKYLSVFDNIIHNEPHSLGVIDSFSALSAEAELTGDITDVQVAAMNRYLAKFTRKFANVLPINRVTLVGITHLMANINKFGKGRAHVEKSGNAIKYAQDVKLWGTHITPIMQGETQIGQKVHWIIENSALGPPGQKVTSIVKYGRGIWNEMEIAELGKDFGIIEGTGWFTLPGVEKKIQGMSNVATYLEENENAYSDLKSKVYEMLGMPCV